MSSALCFTLISFLCLLPLSVFAQTTKNIALGSSLTAGEESSWLSPSGDFAFGFQLVGTGSYLLAIWFNKIPERTITWSANRDVLAQRGAKLQLTAGGRLVLTDTTGAEIWSATASGVAYAAVLDTGNLVLVDTNSVILWQSFDAPTDTILPLQVMNQGAALVSRFSDTNYSSGRFQLIMQDDGNLVFYTLNYPQDSIEYYAYTATSTVGSGYRLVFNQSGSIYVTAKNGSVVAHVLSYQKPQGDLYERAILEFDGVLRKYVHPRSSSSGTPMKWAMQDFAPQDICSQMHTTVGGGACGLNSYCQIGSDERPKCGCPPGYSFLDETDRMKGCKQDFAPPRCSEKESQFRLVEMDATNFWGSDYETFLTEAEAACRESCLSDCLCAAAVFNGKQCWKKRLPLSNGWVGPSVVGKTFIKVRAGSSAANHQPARLEPKAQPLTGGGVKENKH